MDPLHHPRKILSLCVALLVITCASKEDARPAAEERVFVKQMGIAPLLLSVTSNHGDIWMCGGGRGPRGGRIVRLINRTLMAVEIPEGPVLWWLWPDGEGGMKAVGENGRLLETDGRIWRQSFPIDNPKVTFWGGWTAPGGLTWVVGGSRDRHGPKGIILRRSSTEPWSQMATDALGVTGNLYKVWGRGPGEVFFVGEGGIILRWNGSGLSRVVCDVDTLLFTVHGNSQGLTLVVGGVDQGIILRLEGDGCIREALPPGTPPLSGIYVRESGDAIAVGDRGVILTRQPDGQWGRMTAQGLGDLGSQTLHGVHGDDGFWAVGGDFSAGQGGLIVSDHFTPLGVIPENDAGPGMERALDMGVASAFDMTPDGDRILDAGPVVDAMIFEDANGDVDTSRRSDASSEAGVGADADGAEVCGDGVVGGTETCDDGNLAANDGCSEICRVECGDGDLGPLETCDDGNVSNGDGCSAGCELECGDGDRGANEGCDDGNRLDGDGCSSLCVAECGNGQLDANETCDDANTVGGDGCDEICGVECGNGRLDGDEECDDGNRAAGDGCSDLCIDERPAAGEACDVLPCRGIYECLGVAAADFFPVCTVMCMDVRDCQDAGFDEDVRCDIIGPQLIDTYCVPARCLDGTC